MAQAPQLRVSMLRSPISAQAKLLAASRIEEGDGKVVKSAWKSFRRLPRWGQVTCWLLFAPGPLIAWGASGGRLKQLCAAMFVVVWSSIMIAAVLEPSAPGPKPAEKAETATTTTGIPTSTAGIAPTTAPTTTTTTRPEAKPADDPAAQLVVAAERNADTYLRDLFPHWLDLDSDGCNTRCEVLSAEKLAGGGWMSTYDGLLVYDASDIDIDHLVPLAEAWRSGASEWDAAKRAAFANDLGDPATLAAVTASSNRAKRDGDPASWRPQPSEWCSYARSWVKVKVRWGLTADPGEVQSLQQMLATC